MHSLLENHFGYRHGSNSCSFVSVEKDGTRTGWRFDFRDPQIWEQRFPKINVEINNIDTYSVAVRDYDLANEFTRYELPHRQRVYENLGVKIEHESYEWQDFGSAMGYTGVAGKDRDEPLLEVAEVKERLTEKGDSILHLLPDERLEQPLHCRKGVPIAQIEGIGARIMCVPELIWSHTIKILLDIESMSSLQKLERLKNTGAADPYKERALALC
ncbi:MAG: hypothetical protein CMJ64_15195 [Planctomycetaceae bacterium]|nr:hypothetical protein [Planctomycetaceae bacterium]